MTERWLPIPGFPDYSISDTGRVISRRVRREGRPMSTFTASHGYRQVCLVSPDGKEKRFLIHRLVALTFIGEPPSPDMHARHLDGDKLNNHVSNIAWGTRSDNMQDSVRHGTHAMVTKTHCPHGHPYAGDNLWIDSRGRRRCQTCRRSQQRVADAKWRAARRAKRQVAA